MSQRPDVASFLAAEETLRALHADALYVRPRSVETPSGTLALGGWAFLDGEPALILPTLDILVVTFEEDDELVSYGRDASVVFDLLAPYLTLHTAPLAHLAICIPEDDKPSLHSRIVALPDHRGPASRAAPARRAPIVPVLKDGAWPHRALIAHVPLLMRADAPIVCFAEDLPGGYQFVPREGADLDLLWREAFENLRAHEADFTVLPSGITVTAGSEKSAERLLDPDFLRVLHKQWGPDLFISVPHRVALYAIGAGASAETRAQFAALVHHEHAQGPEDGHAPVSALALRVQEGRVVGAITLDELVHTT